MKVYVKYFSFIILACAIGITTPSCKTSSKAQKKQSNGGGKELEGKARIDFEYYFFNANKEKVLGNYEIAESLFSQALQLNPTSAAVMYELANIYPETMILNPQNH